ncbi:MAG: response regulator transcription factor [Pseudomonadota bacterium]
MEILLCSANESVRKRWHTILAGQHDLQEAGSEADLSFFLEEKDRDLILLHRSLVNKELVIKTRRTCPKSKIFLLSDRPTDDEGLDFLKLGIVGYSNTYMSPGRLSEAVRVVLSGSVWIGQMLMQRLILESHAEKKDENLSDKQKKFAELTPREQEIAKLVALGQSNLEIAFNLNITERTAKAHLSSIYAKTGCGSRLNLALMINRG